MKHLSQFPPAPGQGLYYIVLAVLGLLIFLAIAGLAQLPVSTDLAWCPSNAPGLLLA